MICKENINTLIQTFENLKIKYKNYDIHKYKNYKTDNPDLKIFIENHIDVIINIKQNLQNIEELIMNLEFLIDNEKFEYIYEECKNIIENIKDTDLYINNHEKVLLFCK